MTVSYLVPGGSVMLLRSWLKQPARGLSIPKILCGGRSYGREQQPIEAYCAA